MPQCRAALTRGAKLARGCGGWGSGRAEPEEEGQSGSRHHNSSHVPARVLRRAQRRKPARRGTLHATEGFSPGADAVTSMLGEDRGKGRTSALGTAASAALRRKGRDAFGRASGRGGAGGVHGSEGPAASEDPQRKGAEIATVLPARAAWRRSTGSRPNRGGAVRGEARRGAARRGEPGRAGATRGGGELGRAGERGKNRRSWRLLQSKLSSDGACSARRARRRGGIGAPRAWRCRRRPPSAPASPLAAPPA